MILVFSQEGHGVRPQTTERIIEVSHQRYIHSAANARLIYFLRSDVTYGHLMNPEFEIEAIKGAIRSAGLRATPARVATLQIIRAAFAPLTHAEVADQLGKNGVDKATAFRNLNDLTDAGLLRRSELGGNVYRFEEIRAEEKDHPHPHFVCVECGKISCMSNVKLTANSKRESEEFGEVTEILLRGHCKECL